MMLRKQTVWLLTMLAVMVVLSGYYLVKGPNDQIPALGEETKKSEPLMGVEVQTKQTDIPPKDATPVEAKSTTVGDLTQKSGQDALSGSEYFQGSRLHREAMIQQQKDEQMKIWMSSDSPQVSADAKKKFDELNDIDTKSQALEDLIKAKGYKDALVNMQDDIVSVVVQKDKLEKKEAVDIIALVTENLKVSGQNVRVLYHQ